MSALALVGVELRKLATRPRTWVSIGLLCLLPLVVAVFLATTDVAPRPGQGPALLSQVLANGELYAVAALGLVLPVFLPIAVCVVAGDTVAGEASAGTLRYLLVRPVGRTRLLAAKLVAVLVFTLLAVVAVTVVSYAAGVGLLGHGAVEVATGGGGLTLSGTALSTAQLVERTLMVMAYVTVSMLAVASVSLLLSTLVDSPLTAALGGLALLVASTVLVALDAAQVLHPLLPTRYWLSWVDLFRDPILWSDVRRGVLVQLGWSAVLLAAAWANFTSRDVTS